MEFKVGDRVRAIREVDGVYLANRCGTVVITCIAGDCAEIGVEFDEPFWSGNDCFGKGKMGHCRYGLESEFELISRKQKIVITTDGRETLARLYEGNKVIKSATAKCNPKDTFDFKVGADLAFDRLMGEAGKVAEPKYFKGKAVCIKSNTHRIVVGKIYDFSENNGRGNNGGNPILSYARRSIKEINEALFGDVEFLEIKE